MTSTCPEDKGSATVRIGTSLSIYEVASIREELISHLQNHGKLILELDEVQVCDAAGFQLLYAIRKTADNVGKTVTIRDPSSAVLKTAKDIGDNTDALLNMGHSR